MKVAKRLRSKPGKTAMLGHPGWLSLRGRRGQAPLISHCGFAAICLSAPVIGTKRPLKSGPLWPTARDLDSLDCLGAGSSVSV
jgi:hypothetical protein